MSTPATSTSPSRKWLRRLIVTLAGAFALMFFWPNIQDDVWPFVKEQWTNLQNWFSTKTPKGTEIHAGGNIIQFELGGNIKLKFHYWSPDNSPPGVAQSIFDQLEIKVRFRTYQETDWFPLELFMSAKLDLYEMDGIFVRMINGPNEKSYVWVEQLPK